MNIEVLSVETGEANTGSGITAQTEMAHESSGRLRVKAIIADEDVREPC